MRPKTPTDLSLAPVAAEIDSNLQRLRSKGSDEEIVAELQLELDSTAMDDTREERADRVLAVALRDVDLRGWDAALSDDAARVRLTGGSVSLDVGLSAALLRYIEGGA